MLVVYQAVSSVCSAIMLIMLFLSTAVRANQEPIIQTENLPPRASLEMTSRPVSVGLREIALLSHNEVRRQWYLKPVKWDEKLALSAAQWAHNLSRRGVIQHSGRGDGENLWMGTAGAYSYEEMLAAWVSEQQFFRPGVFPNISTTADWRDVGHFTQMIWHRTSHIGCAVSRYQGWDFLVCRYSGAGNVIGENPLG